LQFDTALILLKYFIIRALEATNEVCCDIDIFHDSLYVIREGGDRWSSGQCARRAIAEAKHQSQWPVIGWVTKIYYLELLRASEGMLTRWSRLHLQSFAPTPVLRRVDVRQAAGRKNNCRIFITT
jgi:ribonuclease HI